MRRAILIAFLLTTTVAYARPGTTDAYEAVAEWRDQALETMHLALFGMDAVSCGLRERPWMGKLNDYVRWSNRTTKQRYRASVTDKALYDRLMIPVEGELNGWYWNRSEIEAGIGSSTSACLEVRRHPDALRILDYEASHRWKD